MPLRDEEIRYDLTCGRSPDGRWRCGIRISVPLEALRPLGLHPDQPTSKIVGPSPPRWWHAAGDRYAQTRP